MSPQAQSTRIAPQLFFLGVFTQIFGQTRIRHWATAFTVTP